MSEVIANLRYMSALAPPVWQQYMANVQTKHQIWALLLGCAILN